jgi:AcrR family transcriptional regulator
VGRVSQAVAARRPGRPVGHTGDETRARILQAALECFAERGLAGSSVRDIANSATIRVSTLYHYFPSKDALYREVQERVHEELHAIVVEEMARGLGLADLTRAIVGRTFDYFLENRTCLQLWCRNAVEPASLDEASRDRRAHWVEFIEQTLGPARERGDVKAIDPVHLMVTIDALVHWHLLSEAHYRDLLGRGFEDPEVVARTREHVIGVALRMIGLE